MMSSSAHCTQRRKFSNLQPGRFLQIYEPAWRSDRSTGFACFLEPVEPHQSKRVSPHACREVAKIAPRALELGAGRRRFALELGDQEAPARARAMFHARGHFLADVAALLEVDTAELLEARVEGKHRVGRQIAAVGHAKAKPMRLVIAGFSFVDDPLQLRACCDHS